MKPDSSAASQNFGTQSAGLPSRLFSSWPTFAPFALFPALVGKHSILNRPPYHLSLNGSRSVVESYILTIVTFPPRCAFIARQLVSQCLTYYYNVLLVPRRLVHHLSTLNIRHFES